MKRTIGLGLLLTASALLASSANAQRGQERYYSGQGTVTCESNRSGYRECFTGYRAPPQLVQQLSGSACQDGRSWGHRPGMVWVNDGCRAVFEESRGWGPGGGGGGNTANAVLCESRGGRYQECRTNFRGTVELTEQLSSQACIEGRTWGQTRGAVWVDGGCRARFAEYYGWEDSNWGQGQGYTSACDSRDGRYKRCDWDFQQGTPFLLEQYSSSPCVRGRSWGYDTRRGELWVNEGCRALFGSR
jgi:hypothetical protein